VDDSGTVFIADSGNHRIVAWNKGDNEGHVVAGGQGKGNGLHQLNHPTDFLIDINTDSLIICDWGNRRIVRWSLKNEKAVFWWPFNYSRRGEVLVDNISCRGLAMDKEKCLYVGDADKHAVKRFARGDIHGVVVAGGIADGNTLDESSRPSHTFVHGESSLYEADFRNQCVMR
jgi:hypothetical protein